jgi:malate synthase
MASELEQRLAEEEKVKNPIGIPECLVDITRRVVPHGAGRVDSIGALTKTWASAFARHLK